MLHKEKGKKIIKKQKDENTNRLLNLGDCHKFGLGRKVNHKEAFKNYKEASKLGNLMAKIRLADCYLDGEGVKQNQKIAFEMYQEVFDAIPDSSPIINIKARAAARLGSCYMNGEGVKKNDKLTYSYFKWAAFKNDVYGYLGLATCYIEGIGCSKNPKIALEHYNKAIDLFAPIDIYELINYFREKKNMVKIHFLPKLNKKLAK